jgi:hypothetical protein
MAQNLESPKTIRIFLASPSDVEEERDALSAFIQEINDVLAFLVPDRALPARAEGCRWRIIFGRLRFIGSHWFMSELECRHPSLHRSQFVDYIGKPREGYCPARCDQSLRVTALHHRIDRARCRLLERRIVQLGQLIKCAPRHRQNLYTCSFSNAGIASDPHQTLGRRRVERQIVLDHFLKFAMGQRLLCGD